MHVPSFNTPEVRELYAQLRGWDHPDHPFLDASYSPASLAPAVDLTSTVATWLAGGREVAVEELWRFITPDTRASGYALRKALSARFPPWLKLAEWQEHELRAIHVLGTRAALIHRPEEIAFVIRQLTASTLSTAPIEIDPTEIGKLLRAAKSEVHDSSPYDVAGGKANAAFYSIERIQGPLGAEAAVIDRIRSIPPMARLVINDYLARSWAQGTLRFDLYYGERMYGCSSGWNEHYIRWTELFSPPTDDGPVSSAVTKQILSEALLSNGIVQKKSASRATMLGVARQIPGLISGLVGRVDPSRQALRAELSSATKEWSHRMRAVEAASGGVIKLLAASVIGRS